MLVPKSITCVRITHQTEAFDYAESYSEKLFVLNSFVENCYAIARLTKLAAEFDMSILTYNHPHTL